MEKEITTKMGYPGLKAKLPHGAIARLSEKYNKSWTWINAVITGKAQGEAGIIEDAERVGEIFDNARNEIRKIFN